MSEEAPRLPVGYYLLNVETVVREVRARYGDLLLDGERRVLEAFLALPLDARRLYVRMLTRKGPWFREDALTYPEIASTAEALAILGEAGFCETRATAAELLPLLVRRELAEGLARFGLPGGAGLGREAMARLLAENVEASRLEQDLRALLKPARLLHGGLWSLLCFLFFGNGEQDLSSFVLADIGRIRYEAYALDPSHRLFQARADLDFLLSLRALGDALEGAGADADRLATLTDDALAMEPHPGVRQQRRYQRLLNGLGRAWERLGERGRARQCYGRSGLPPARERLARLAEDPVQACGLAIRIGETPLDPGEARFARVFLKRHARRVPEADQWLREHPEADALPERRLRLPRRASVEQAVLEAARADGWEGFFAENVLWNAFFGLVFWEELFAPVPGAFQHRFQSAPLDLGQPAFGESRKAAIEERLASLREPGALARHVLATADAKWGIANAFLSWRHLTREMLAAAAHRVPFPVLESVLRTMVRNPRAFSSGFPDLFLFRPEGAGWAVWEVKGPGDSLRPDQERWLRQFLHLGCDACVAWVKWSEACSFPDPACPADTVVS